ncbi:MAG: SGNH/GDSL hydrolase family protein [Bacteroidales bacterium]|jgi:lysophospholipase L1-like esterase|nr:SGNH/GDSL hydrolase family protein [Bacteroidales bacterium]
MERRTFLKKAALSGAVIGLADSIIASTVNIPSSAKITLKEGATVLFQGDSITDAGRDRKVSTPNTSPMMGMGYAILAAGALLEKYAEKHPVMINKGVSGDKVFQLKARWDAECINLKPDVLSILVGVNDFWHTKSGGYKGTARTYETDYRALLQRTKEALPEVKLLIGEPYAVLGVNAVDNSWFPAFDEYRNAARKLAEEFNAVFIPYQKVYEEAQKRAAPSYWTHDGVHASLAGAQLMAKAWMQAFE